MQCPQISDEKKTSFAPLMNLFLIRFLKDQKLLQVLPAKSIS